MFAHIQYYNQPAQSSSDSLAIFISCCIVLAAIVYVVLNKRREATASEGVKLAKENGLLERYKPVLLRLASVAPDTRVLKKTLTAAELVGTIKGCKTYLILQHKSFPKPIVDLTVAVVTPIEIRKRTLTYTEPMNALDI